MPPEGTPSMGSTGRLCRGHVAVLAFVVAGAALALPSGAGSASGDPGHERDASERVRAVTSEPVDGTSMSETTLDRLASATALEPARAWPRSGELPGLAARFADERRQGKVPRKRMPRSVGKLYTVDGTAIGECSAFAVRDPKYPKQRSYVVTAGHCLVDPKTKDWIDAAEFYPKYYGEGGSSFGGWDVKRFRTYGKWFHKGQWRFDIGVVKVQRFEHKQIVDRIGGNRLAYGAEPRDKQARFIGYPAAGRYDGKFPYQCVGRAHGSRAKPWMTVMPCATREGASGGPWFRRMLNRNTGVAYAALSRGTKSGNRVITAPTFRKSLRRIIFESAW